MPGTTDSESPAKKRAIEPARFAAMADVGFRGLVLNLLAMLLLTALGGVLGFVLFGFPLLGILTGIVPLIGLFSVITAQVHVGADGVLWNTRRRPKFFAWRDVVRVEPYVFGVRLVLRADANARQPERKVHIPFAARSLSGPQLAMRDGMLARSQTALAEFQRAEAPDAAVRVARGTRSTDAWFAALQNREGTFREAPVQSEDLWRIVECPISSPTARAGAAVMLAGQAKGNTEDWNRLRVAAESCAEPRLRVVLDKAAAGQSVLEHLDDVADDESRARA